MRPIKFLRIVLLTVFLLHPFFSYARFDLGAGGVFGSPLSFNPNIGGYHHAKTSLGIRAALNYVPSNTNFIPSLTFSMAPWVLPVTKFGFNQVLNMEFMATTVTVSALYRKVNGNKEFYFGPGIGVASLKGNGVNIHTENGTGGGRAIDDSSTYIKSLMPNINFSAEYIFPISSEKPLFAGIGAQIQYVYFFDNSTTYKIYVVDDGGSFYALQPKLAGHMINPCVYLSVYYRFGKSE